MDSFSGPPPPPGGRPNPPPGGGGGPPAPPGGGGGGFFFGTPPRACGATLPLQGRVGDGALPKREYRIDQIVPRSLLAELHLQPVGEEGEEVSQLRRYVEPFSQGYGRSDAKILMN